ncbi:MAG: diguanylate cyclase [Clostridiales bacterium]|nr:diguanylate cyclase [Clostridiales bacterium]
MKRYNQLLNESSFPIAENQKILIVDDSAMVLKILYDMLKNEYVVIQAKSGEEALQLAVREIPDLILLDVIMKDMDGYQVCKVFKSDPLTKNIPIIFVSGLNEQNDEKKGLELGAIDYITKPFSEPIVKIRIKNHLELKAYRDFLEQISSLDGLTGIYNRRYFNTYYLREWERAIRERTPISLIIIDIDRFKEYNDNLGHLAGDECLKKISGSIGNSLFRKNDIACRLGGEEFICVLPNTDLPDAVCIAERIAADIEKLNIPHEYSDVKPIITVSMGVGTIIPIENYSYIEFLNMTDRLLYHAKKSGRNKIQAKYIVLHNKK